MKTLHRSLVLAAVTATTLAVGCIGSPNRFGLPSRRPLSELAPEGHAPESQTAPPEIEVPDALPEFQGPPDAGMESGSATKANESSGPYRATIRGQSAGR